MDINNGNFTNKKKTNKIDNFWMIKQYKSINEPLDYRHLNLPLARIKRLMKVEEDVKMVANEVPILFSKITEDFIEELTLRAWINTDESKRRILQRCDVSAAVRTSDMFDFLIYIIPKGNIDETNGKMCKTEMVGCEGDKIMGAVGEALGIDNTYIPNGGYLGDYNSPDIPKQ